jgi:hypothetical protein
MRNIAARLFGPEARRLLDLFDPEDGLDDRVRDSGEWCRSTPGRGAAGRLDIMLRGKGQAPRPGADGWCERA